MNRVLTDDIDEDYEIEVEDEEDEEDLTEYTNDEICEIMGEYRYQQFRDEKES